MTLSALIAKLQELEAAHGNLPVVLDDLDGEGFQVVAALQVQPLARLDAQLYDTPLKGYAGEPVLVLKP